jgi:1-aminocyclopropane-1-carboxylate deaminase/D-cysteine desulfhydrase-like pyridoxal-dependent ACC family enzyme
MNFTPSAFEKYHYLGKDFFVKRDDLLHKDFSGNKARKFHYFLQNDFPSIKKVVSYGSNQSNAMYSLSVLAKMQNWEFVYFCSHISSFLKQNPQGNYKAAIQNGMKIFETQRRKEEAWNLADEETLIIDEGGRQSEARYGIKILADELLQDIQNAKLKNPKLYLPSGTGTTALFLQKYLPIDVFTCSTVGDEEYLKKQWKMLESNERYFPKILHVKKKYHYGKLNIELYRLWKDLFDTMNVEFDLMYDAVGWKKLLEHYEKFGDNELIYLHQGGVKGNESMLQRYKYKYDIMKNY